MSFCRVERDGHLLVVTLDRPEVRNALHRAASDELDQVWAAFEADAELRVGILTGTGDKSFSAGYDMKESGTPTKGSDFLAQRHPRGLGGLTLQYELTKPLIAAVNGVALGGGFELALACDIIVAAEHAEFGFPEPRVGRMALEGGMHRLARSIPLKTAMAMLLTGRRIGADEARRIGLVSEGVPLSDLLPAARRWAHEILDCAPLSVQATKEAVLAGLSVSLPAAVSLCSPTMSRALASDHLPEGPSAVCGRPGPNSAGR